MIPRYSLRYQARRPRTVRTHRASRRLLVKMPTAPFRQAKTCKAPNGKRPSQMGRILCNLNRIRSQTGTNLVRLGRPRTDNPRATGLGKTRNPRNPGKRSQRNLGRHSRLSLGRQSPRKWIVRHRGNPSPAQDNPRRGLPSPASRGSPPRASRGRHRQPNLGKRSQPNRGRYSQRSPDKRSHLSLDSVHPVNPDKLSQGRASLLWLSRDRARASPAVAKARRARASKPAPLSAHLWMRSGPPGRPR